MSDIIKDLENDTLLNRVSDEHPLKIAYKNDNSYYTEFKKIVKRLSDKMTKRQINEFLSSILMLDSKYDLFRYLQSACELNVLSYVLNEYNDSFQYEPQHNGKKNPECSFIHKGITVNVEVKTPDLNKRWEANERKTLKIFAPERIPNEKLDEFNSIMNELLDESQFTITSKYEGVELLPRLDNKLTDYLGSAQSKFPESIDKNFNILVISLCELEDLDEWYNYLFSREGVFNTPLNIIHKTDRNRKEVVVNYDKIDAILLTNTVRGHLQFKDVFNVWDMHSYYSFIFLNPDRQSLKWGTYQELLRFMNTRTVDLFDFQNELDNNEKSQCIDKIKNPSVLKKIIDNEIIRFQTITEYHKNLMKRNQEGQN